MRRGACSHAMALPTIRAARSAMRAPGIPPVRKPRRRILGIATGSRAKAGPREVGRLAAPVLRKFGVARAWVYGSFALGCANAHSDVDLIVEMPPGVVLGRSFFDLRRELEEAFGRKVDLHLPPNDSARAEYVRVLERTKVLVFDEHFSNSAPG